MVHTKNDQFTRVLQAAATLGSGAGSTNGKVLILGASKEMEPFVTSLLNQRIPLIMVDRSPNLPASYCEHHKDLLEVVELDFSDEQKLNDFIKTKDIVHTIALPVGRSLVALGKINDKYGFTGPSFEAINICTDKYEFHKFLASINVPTATHRQQQESAALGESFGGKANNALAAFHDCAYLAATKEDFTQDKVGALRAKVERSLTYPLIIKSNFGSGSRGVRLVHNAQEFESYVPFDFGDDVLLIEEAIDGDEFSLDAFVSSEGLVYCLGLFYKDVSAEPYRQETSYYIISENSVWEHIKSTFNKVAKELNLRNSFIHCDFFLDKSDRVYIIDISCRMGGNDLIGPLSYFGHDPCVIFAKAVVAGDKECLAKLDEDMIFQPKKSALMSFFDFKKSGIYQGEKGTLDDIFTDDEICNIVALQNHMKKGDKVGPMTQGSDCHRGYIMVQYDKIEDACSIIERYLNNQIIEEA